MSFLDFFRKPISAKGIGYGAGDDKNNTNFKIDPLLKQRLQAKGRQDQIDSINKTFRSAGSFFLDNQTGAEAGAKVAKPIIPALSKAATAAATSLFTPEANRIEQQNLESQKRLAAAVRAKAQAGKLTDEEHARYTKMMSQMSDVDATQGLDQINFSLKDAGAAIAEGASLAAGGYAFAPSKAAQALTLAADASRIAKYGETGGKLLNYGLKTAKVAAIDAGIGATAFGGNAASQDKSGPEIAKEAALGGAGSAAFPIVAGGVIRGLGAAARGALDYGVNPALEKAGNYLERVATGATKAERIAEANNEVEKTLAVIPSAAQSFKQKAAQTVLDVADKVKKLPQQWYNRFSPLADIEQQMLELKGAPLAESEKFERNARLASATAAGQTKTTMNDLFVGTKDKPAILGQFDDQREAVKARLIKLDAIARTEAGQATASEESLPELKSGLQRLVSEAGDKDPEIEKAVGEWNKFNRKLLDEKVANGIISEDARDAMLKKYPNYIPHNVIFDTDEQAGQELLRRAGSAGQSLNVTDNGIKAATGSTREIEDPYVALAHRLNSHYQVIEKNKVLQGLVQAQEQHGLIDGMRPLVTAKQTNERKAAIVELQALKEEAANVRKSLGMTKGQDSALATRLGKLEDEINERSQKAIDLFTSQTPEQASQLEGMLTKKTGKTDYSRGVLDRDIYYAQKEVNTAEKALEPFRVAASEGDSTAGKKEFNALEAAQKKLADLQTKKNTPADILYKYRNNTVNPKTVIDSAIPKTSSDIKSLKNQIASREDKVGMTTELKTRTEKMLDQLDASLDVIKDRRKSAFEDLQGLSADKKGIGEQTINVFRDGVKESWVVPSDIAVAVKNLDSEQMGTIMRALTAPTRLLKSLSTDKNLSFILPNKLRDKQTALLTADAFIQDMVKKSGVTPQKVDLAKDDLYKLWLDSGGGFSSIFDEGKFDIKDLDKMAGNQSVVRKFANSARPDNIVEKLNQSMEESTRLEVFKKGLQQGLSPKDAAFASREATVDFAKMGTMMKNLNQIVPFLNARVQGAVNLARAAKLSPETFARMQMWSAVYPTLALDRWNSQFESSKNIPQYFYDQYWPIMVGETDGQDNNGNPVKIPKFISIKKGEGQALVANPIQYFLRHARGEDPRRVSQMITSTIGAASPIDVGIGGSGQKNPFLALASQFGPVANIAIGLGTNIDPFSGQEIIPESRKNASTKNQFKTTTPETTKTLAKLFGVSPANLEFIINSFGGVAQDAQQTANIAAGAFEGEGLRTNPLEDSKFGEATKLPIASKFVRESTGFGSAQDQVNRQLKGNVTQQATDESLKVNDKANEIFQHLNKLKTQDEKIKYLEQEDPDADVRKKVSQLKKSKQSVEVLSTSDSTEIRALYIHQRLLEMTRDGVNPQDRVQFLQDLDDAKILTKAVRERIAQLKQE